MGTYQNLQMQEKEMFLKNKIGQLKKILLIFIFFYNTSANSTEDQNLNKIISEYFLKISEFSSNFLQSDGNTVEEGLFYLKNKRLKIQYTKPSKIKIIIAK